MKTVLFLVFFMLTTPSILAQDDSEKEFSIVEQDPVPTGDDLFTYINKHIKYPRKAIEEGVGGKVFLTFVIEKSGEVRDVKLLKGAGFGMDEEALRVIREMPNWNPGRNAGRRVKVRMNIPIVFRMEEEEFTKEDTLEVLKKYGKALKKDWEASIHFRSIKENETHEQFKNQQRMYESFSRARLSHYKEIYLKDTKAERAKRRLLKHDILMSFHSEKVSFEKIGSYHKKSQSGKVKICGKKFNLALPEADFESLKSRQAETQILADFQLDSEGKNTECFNIRITHPANGRIFILDERKPLR